MVVIFLIKYLYLNVIFKILLKFVRAHILYLICICKHPFVILADILFSPYPQKIDCFRRHKHYLKNISAKTLYFLLIRKKQKCLLKWQIIVCCCTSIDKLMFLPI